MGNTSLGLKCNPCFHMYSCLTKINTNVSLNKFNIDLVFKNTG